MRASLITLRDPSNQEEKERIHSLNPRIQNGNKFIDFPLPEIEMRSKHHDKHKIES